MRTIRLLAAYGRRSFLQWLAWRGFLFSLAINQALPPLIGLAIWATALPGQNVSLYYVALLVVRLATVSYEQHTFSNGVYSGDFTDDLVRPHAAVTPLVSVNLAMRALHVLICTPLIVVVALWSGVRIDGTLVMLALPAVVLAGALQFLWTYLLALSAFWTERAHGVTALGSTLIFLLGGEAAPLYLVSPTLQAWTTALPFRSMMGFPAEIVAGHLDGAALVTGYLWQIVWLGIFAALANRVWRAGIRRYTAVGG